MIKLDYKLNIDTDGILTEMKKVEDISKKIDEVANFSLTSLRLSFILWTITAVVGLVVDIPYAIYCWMYALSSMCIVLLITYMRYKRHLISEGKFEGINVTVGSYKKIASTYRYHLKGIVTHRDNIARILSTSDVRDDVYNGKDMVVLLLRPKIYQLLYCEDTLDLCIYDTGSNVMMTMCHLPKPLPYSGKSVPIIDTKYIKFEVRIDVDKEDKV